MEWQESEQDDSERLVDVLPLKAVQISEGTDVLDIKEDDTAHAKFKGKLYPVKIVGKGMLCLCVYNIHLYNVCPAIPVLAHLKYLQFSS